MVNKSPLATTVAALSIVAVTSAGAVVGPTPAGDIVGQGAVGAIRTFGDDIGLTVGLNQTSSFTAAFRGATGYSDRPNEEPVNFLCKFLIWSFLCCLLATRGQARETKLGDGI